MRIFFSVGEPSGDLHGSNLVRHLTYHDPSIECVGFGGPKMEAAGCDVHFDLTSLAVMFLAKVVANLKTFFRLIDDANDFFRDQHVDAVVLIDYPGFNWWIARKAKKHGIPVFYYGIPQVWAWAPWRVRKIRRLVDHVLCKLPFEVEWFAKRKCRATFVGHPYFDQLSKQSYDQAFIDTLLAGNQKWLTLLPGSRDQEVENNLPILVNAAEEIAAAIPGMKVAIACFSPRQLEIAQTITQATVPSGSDSPRQRIRKSIDFTLFTGRTPELMKTATVCLACSGSVSLELLYHRKPTVIVYKVKKWIMFAQAILLRTKFITLVNLIATDNIKKTSWRPYDPDAKNSEAAVMPEYLTTGDPSSRVAAHAIAWLTKPELYDKKVAELNRLAARVAKPGATEKAAAYILKQLQDSKMPVSNDSRPLRKFA